MIAKTETPRVPVLDGLRALAIILVLMRHGVRPFWEDLHQPFLKFGGVEFGSLFINGWMGVDLFFVLSGFLIASQLLGRYYNKRAQTMDILPYLKRRFLRIAPAYYVVLTLAVLGLFPYYPYPENHDHIIWRYVYHLLFLQDYFPSDIVTVFWSLAVEMKFYLLAPFLLLLLLKLKTTRARENILIALFALMPVLRYYTVTAHPEFNSYELYFENVRSVFHLTLDGLIVGLACAVLWADLKWRAVFQRPNVANILFFTGLAGFLVAALAFGPLYDLGSSPLTKILMPSLIAASFGGMLLGLLGGCKATSVFSWYLWKPIALVSYSLYLFHLPLMYPAEILCRHFVALDAYGPQFKMLLYAPFFLGLTGFVATLSYRFIERPFLRR